MVSGQRASVRAAPSCSLLQVRDSPPHLLAGDASSSFGMAQRGGKGEGRRFLGTVELNLQV